MPHTIDDPRRLPCIILEKPIHRPPITSLAQWTKLIRSPRSQLGKCFAEEIRRRVPGEAVVNWERLVADVERHLGDVHSGSLCSLRFTHSMRRCQIIRTYIRPETAWASSKQKRPRQFLTEVRPVMNLGYQNSTMTPTVTLLEWTVELPSWPS